MMTNIGFHASHEQFAPSHLLTLVGKAEAAGFDCINCSDHFHPWSTRQGHSGFSFSWLGAAMQSSSIPFSVVCAPGQRYHPAIIAQAVSTLAEMFPKRFSVHLGSGEALNESITGLPWPEKSDRNQRLYECYQIIKSLLAGETVTHEGLVTINSARIYSLPTFMPALNGAAVTAETARWMANWVDGLITIHRPLEELRNVIEGFRNNGGMFKPVSVKVQISYSRDLKRAESGALDQWRTNVLPAKLLATFSKVHEFDEAAKNISLDEVEKMVHISNDPSYFIDVIRSYKSLGIDNIIIHNVNKDQEEFIEDFGKLVLPNLHK